MHLPVGWLLGDKTFVAAKLINTQKTAGASSSPRFLNNNPFPYFDLDNRYKKYGAPITATTIPVGISFG